MNESVLLMEEKYILSHQITIQILMHFKKFPNKEFGIRETRRALKLKSPSTVSTHIHKLVGMELLEKTESNRFIITEDGINFKDIQFQVTVTPQYIWGKFVPKYSLLIVFLITSILLNIVGVLVGMNQGVMVLNIWFVLPIVLIIIVREWLFFKHKYEQYLESIETI